MLRSDAASHSYTCTVCSAFTLTESRSVDHIKDVFCSLESRVELNACRHISCVHLEDRALRSLHLHVERMLDVTLDDAVLVVNPLLSLLALCD